MLDQARFVLNYCRARDRAEIEAVIGYERACAGFLEPWLESAVLAEVFAHEGEPAALIAVHEITARTVALSLVATYRWRRVALAVAKWARRQCMPELLARGYRRAECRAIDGHDEARRFLEFLGFTLECRCPEFGRNGEAFLQYAWRSKDHGLTCTALLSVEQCTRANHEDEKRADAPMLLPRSG